MICERQETEREIELEDVEAPNFYFDGDSDDYEDWNSE